MDKAISMLVGSALTADELRDRNVRIAAVDAELKDRAQQEERRKQQRQEARLLKKQQRQDRMRQMQQQQADSNVVIVVNHDDNDDNEDDDSDDGGSNGDSHDSSHSNVSSQSNDDDDFDDDFMVDGSSSVLGISVRHPQYTVSLAPDRRTACRICCQIIETNLLRLKQILPTPIGQDTPIPPQHYHLSCFVYNPLQPRLQLNELLGLSTLPTEIRQLVHSLVRNTIPRG